MAIELWEGTPGSGKTTCCIASAIDHLLSGGVVFSNFRLVDGWADIIAAHHPRVLLRLEKKEELARRLYDRWLSVGSLESCIAAARMVPDLVTGKIAKRFEGQGLLLLDEVQLVFNSRSWRDNFGWIEFFTQHRKYKVDVRLIAHDIEMVDSQIRPLVEYRVSSRNLQRVRVPIIKVPMSYFYGGGSVFMSIWRYAGKGPGSGIKVKSEVKRVRKWLFQLFDSHRIFSADDDLPSKTEKMGPAPAAPGTPGNAIGGHHLDSLRSVFEDIRFLVRPDRSH